MNERVRLTPEAIDRLTANTEPWLSCDDCFEQLDVIIDGLTRSNLPLPDAFRVHLMTCPACDEEARSLAALVGAVIR
ncbi:hypothetical protein [Agromyces sp. Marseille-P2726]|uniref:hypothetical protein n=1 Tax=Agromyces sp. Marseille-P2726 TaxID=2709132 RepID=UPI00157145A5|nr:hypothetical protein [Agromyces sp. Marseille-P2726]